MRRDLNTCSRQSAMHHGVRVRVFFRRSSEHHSRNDSSSSSTSWSHDVNVLERKKNVMVYFLYWHLYLVKKQKTFDQFFEFLKIARPWPSLSHRPCKNTRFRICLRQLWTTYHVIAQVGLVNMCACMNPSALQLVPCALSMVDLSGQLRCWITHIRCTEECFVFYFWHPMLVRPVMKRLFLGKPRKKWLA